MLKLEGKKFKLEEVRKYKMQKSKIKHEYLAE